jgi:hypothetical protein
MHPALLGVERSILVPLDSGPASPPDAPAPEPRGPQKQAIQSPGGPRSRSAIGGDWRLGEQSDKTRVAWAEGPSGRAHATHIVGTYSHARAGIRTRTGLPPGDFKGREPLGIQGAHRGKFTGRPANTRGIAGPIVQTVVQTLWDPCLSATFTGMHSSHLLPGTLLRWNTRNTPSSLLLLTL